MRRLTLLLATVFGIGYLPISGTFGSVVGVAAAWLIKDLTSIPYLITVVGFSFLAIWVSQMAELFLAKVDPPAVVIDEVAGMMVALAFLPFDIEVVVGSFLLFRLFDVWKPFPVNWAQAKLPGGWGVVADDLLAGIYANLVVRIVLAVI